MTKRRLLVLIVGTDGSGKSTLAQHTAKRLSPTASYVYFGLKEFRLPGLRPWINRFGDRSVMLKVVLLPMEYLVRRAALPRQGVVILDRVPGWPFKGTSRVLESLYRTVLPAVDLLVECGGPAKVIAARKGERSQEGCQRDMKKWARVAGRYPARSRLRIDTTTTSIEECVDAIVAALEAVIDGAVSGSGIDEPRGTFGDGENRKS